MTIELQPLWRGASLVAFAGLTMLIAWVTPVPGSSESSGVVMDLPFRVGSMAGNDIDISQAEKLILPSDTEFARRQYISGEGDSITCSIVLSGAEKRSIHRPEICLPGQGWTVKAGEVVDVKLTDGKILPVMNLHLERQHSLPDGRTITLKSYYMYWFVGNNISTPYHGRRVFLTSWDRLVHSKSHRWAYVIVTSMIMEGLQPMGKNEAQTQQMLEAFISKIAPQIIKPAVLESL